MFLMWGGMRFQIFGPHAENARFPNWVRVLTTTAALVVEERSCRRRFLTVKFNNVTEVCRAALMENGVHHGGDLEPNSCLHSKFAS